MKKIILLLLFAYLSLFVTNAQNSLLNEAKYWVWRDRLVNDFMVPGTGTGCGIIMNSRGSNVWNDYPPGSEQGWCKGGFDINDEGFVMGEYLIVLASEWRLLFNSGLPTDKTELEIYYELKTIDRLDNDAEKYWSQYSAFYPNGTSYPNGIINGFMIRDDVFDNFLWYDENLPDASYSVDAYRRYQYLNQGAGGICGKYQQQNIMKSDYNPNDGSSSNILSLSQMNEIIRSSYPDPNLFQFPRYLYPENGGFSAAEAGLHASYPDLLSAHPHPLRENLFSTGPEEYSQDNYIGLLQGLVMINQMVNSNVSVQGINLSSHASTIINRIIHYIRDNNPSNKWNIKNPVTDMCVKGVKWSEFLDQKINFDIITNLFDYCNAGGAEAGAFSNQFAKIHNMYDGSDDDINGQTFGTGLGTDKLSAILVTLSDYKATNEQVCEWIDNLNDGNETELQYLDLLYSILHPNGDINQRGYAHYEDILNNSPCNFDWTSQDAHIYTSNLLPEMIVHNLLKLIKGEKYYVTINDAANYPIIHHESHYIGPPGHEELHEWLSAECSKTIISYNEINSTSTISFFPGDPPNPSGLTNGPCYGNVNYIAGKVIRLMPGFNAIEGSRFHGKIEDVGACPLREGTHNIWEFSPPPEPCDYPPTISDLEWVPAQDQLCHNLPIHITPEIDNSTTCFHNNLYYSWSIDGPINDNPSHFNSVPVHPPVGLYHGTVQAFDDNGGGNIFDFSFYVHENLFCYSSGRYMQKDTTEEYKTDLIDNSISILPNPTSGILTVSSNSEMYFIVEVANTLGENIYRSNYSLGSLVIDLTQQPKGLYFIKVLNTSKLLKIDKIIYK